MNVKEIVPAFPLFSSIRMTSIEQLSTHTAHPTHNSGALTSQGKYVNKREWTEAVFADSLSGTDGLSSYGEVSKVLSEDDRQALTAVENGEFLGLQ
jgi:hypothetical protein